MIRPLVISLLLWLAVIAGWCSAATLQETRWDDAKIRPERLREVDEIIDRIVSNKPRYVSVDEKTGVPWYILSALHNMECSGSFRLHLHEGSPLTGRTRYVPKGRPTEGKPPFEWEFSAVDAVNYDKLPAVDWRWLDDTLYRMEAYNGTGMLRFHKDVPTPYLWSGANLYVRGKYVADGKWDKYAVSKQIGAAVILKRMHERGLINVNLLKRR